MMAMQRTIDTARFNALLRVAAVTALAAASPAMGITFGRLDTFQDGTKQGWKEGFGDSNLSNVDGGPNGVGDKFLSHPSGGLGQPRQIFFNDTTWAGNLKASARNARAVQCEDDRIRRDPAHARCARARSVWRSAGLVNDQFRGCSSGRAVALCVIRPLRPIDAAYRWRSAL
jgi:hypothetical protein